MNGNVRLKYHYKGAEVPMHIWEYGPLESVNPDQSIVDGNKMGVGKVGYDRAMELLCPGWKQKKMVEPEGEEVPIRSLVLFRVIYEKKPEGSGMPGRAFPEINIFLGSRIYCCMENIYLNEKQQN